MKQESVHGLAARSRGLGTSLTSFHLFFEQEAAEVLGIPYQEVMQAALIPVAYTLGTDFKPAAQAVGVDVALGPVASELHMFLLYCTQGLERFCDMFL